MMPIALLTVLLLGQRDPASRCDAGWEPGIWSCSFDRPTAAADGGTALPSVRIGVKCGEAITVCGERQRCTCVRTPDGGVPPGASQPRWYVDPAHPCWGDLSLRPPSCPRPCYPGVDTPPLECASGQICFTANPRQSHVVRGCYAPCGAAGQCPSGQTCLTSTSSERGRAPALTHRICVRPEWLAGP